MTTARKPLASVALALLVAVAVLALAGVSFAGNGHGKGGSPSSAQYKQYGHHRVALCHKGHTIFVAPPAVKAHLKHGDKLGAC
jgi:hypothetical protein